MALNGFRCDECGRPTSGEPCRSVIGRRLCRDCADVVAVASAAVLAGEGSVGAFSLYAWLKAVRRGRQVAEEQGRRAHAERSLEDDRRWREVHLPETVDRPEAVAGVRKTRRPATSTRRPPGASSR